MDIEEASSLTEIVRPRSLRETVWQDELDAEGRYRLEVRKVRPPLGVFRLFAGEICIFGEEGTRLYREDITLPAAVNQETTEEWRARALSVLPGLL